MPRTRSAPKNTPSTDKAYSLSETTDAMRYLETGRARGKIVITLGE